jgi:hypothetical protein
LLALVMTLVGVLLTGCDQANAYLGVPGAVLRTSRTSHPRAEAKRRAPSATSLRSLIHAHTEARSEALYDDDDDVDDDDGGLASQSPEGPDDDAAPGREPVASLSVPTPSLASTALRTLGGLGPSSGHARSTEPPPRA